MIIGEIPKDATVTISIRLNEQNICFNTTVESGMQTVLVMKPVTHNGKIVNFTSEKIHYDIIFQQQEMEKPLIFNHASLKLITDKKGSRHLVATCTNPSASLNRRNHFRLHIGLDGTATVSGSAPYRVVVKDLSYSGVGFVSEKKLPLEIGSNVQVKYTDNQSLARITLNATVVNTRMVEQLHVYGCKLKENNHTSELMKYINAKQRKMIASKMAQKRRF